jgi:Ca-activated chloride channel family protein
MRRLLFAIVATVLLIGSVRADDSYKEINDKAVKLYDSGEFDRATTLLEEARDKNPADPVVNYNLGSAYHQQGEYDKANDTYLNSALSKDSIMRAYSYYNMGNTEFRKGEYQKALDAYKKSIDIDPTDLDAKYNLELTRQKLQEQEQQQCDKNQEKQEDQEQNQDQQDQQQEDQQEQDQQEQQQQQDDQQQEDQQEDQQEQQQDQQQEQSSADQDDDQQQQPQQSQSKETEMSEEDAERLLNAVTGNDRDVLKKLVKLKAPSGGYSGKDW